MFPSCPIRGFTLPPEPRVMAPPAPITRMRPPVNRGNWALNQEARAATGENG